MKLTLKTRERNHVITFWERTQDREIQALFPFSIDSLPSALELFEESQNEDAKSFGKIILADNKYIGDIWCYGIDESDEKTAMLSIVIFDKSYWGKGIASAVIPLFAKEVFKHYDLDTIGAFTYASNSPSRKALQKSGFEEVEFFVEDGIESVYLERAKDKE